MDYKFDFTLYSAKRSLYTFFPLGSPISPVAPPIKNIGLNFTILCNRAIIIIDTRLPRCKESDVGSYPQYTLKILSLSNFDCYF